MNRLVARPPESVAELCLVRLGVQARRLGALPYLARLGRAIDRAATAARAEGSGLLHSERFAFSWRHLGVLQYWQSFEALEAWSHRPPHADWWREAVERARRRGDLGIYHETYLVPRDRIESISIDCEPVGLAAFGPTADAEGPRTTSRDRLGLRGSTP